ncbi:MAG: hypothetical protein CMI01_05905 [Oceanospirillaceae bacterium]|jgi:hypothetical protein|uniref:hypothetical protein n=1 Tax=Marinobacterium litorale TaxID=404770 RepID=UPI00041FE552|nr:hypothetical protein [Marinobacterium litorale]MBS98194.1 hypothetical protein [Oceanospirillaceae bacterium]
MKRTLLSSLALITLTGCIDSGNLLKREAGVGKYYLLDSERLMLCRGQSNDCRDLVLIASSEERMPAIEDAYGASIEPPNYPVSLARMIVNPPAQQYQAQALGNGRYIQLPANDQTDAVWNALDGATDSIYSK